MKFVEGKRVRGAANAGCPRLVPLPLLFGMQGSESASGGKLQSSTVACREDLAFSGTNTRSHGSDQGFGKEDPWP